jgi:photosystem II stability/assembly factor-like uncharacterized protein
MEVVMGHRTCNLICFCSAKRTWVVAGAVLLLAIVACVPQSAIAQAGAIPGRLPGLTAKPVLEGTAKLTGPYAPNQMLRLVFGLERPHLAEEEKFLEELHTHGSPNFQHFLSAAEWNARFSPSKRNEQAVVDWAKSQGLTVTHRYPNRLLVDVEAPVAAIQQALSININNYEVGAKSYFANDRDPVIPPSMMGLIHSVGGLNNLQVLTSGGNSVNQPMFPVYVPGPAFAKGISGGHDGTGKRPKGMSQAKANNPPITNSAYDPTDMFSSQAYDTNALDAQGHCCNPLGNPGVTPPETSIAIATAGTQNGADFTGFHNQYPYLADHWQQFYIDGTPTCCDAEGTMDMEWSTAMANSFGSYVDTAMIYMYDGVNNQFSTFTDIYNHALSDGVARVFSSSWGCAEFDCTPQTVMDTDHGIFNSMIGQGWTLVGISHDGGATTSCVHHDAVSYPGSDPNFVSAGGTQLSLSSGPSYNYEVAWTGGPAGCGANDGGSGGGVSAYWAAPSYQTPLGFASRVVPDIALNADWYYTPQNIFFGGSLQGNGGTSIVAPEIAGFFAQANAYLDYVATITGGCYGGGKCAPIGNGNWYLYWFGENRNYAAHYPFYDITSGCNNNDITSTYGLGYYCAATGYDAVTGWGSINFLQLSWAINTYRAGDFGGPVISFSGPAKSQWYNTDQIVSWSISDSSENGNPATGVAGLSQGWDFDPGDVFSEATPGAGNSFYSGPQYPRSASGCLDFTGALCAGSVGQGWHYVNVRAWDNTGVGSGDYVYGPIGYDTVPPATTSSLSGTKSGSIYVSAVKDTLSATDYSPGSGVASTVYQINGGSVQSYAGPFKISENGNYTVAFHSTDFAGNVEGTESTNFTIARWLPETSGTNAKLLGISCVSATKCEVVGHGGTILGTTNGGASWHAQTSRTTNNLTAVSCLGSFCVAVGDTGTIRVTTNSGGAWTAKTSGTTQNLNGVSCASSTFCVADGNAGTILVTINGGGTWSKKKSGTANNLNAVSCSTTSHCKVVGAAGTIRATINGGATWTGQTSGTTNGLHGAFCRTSTNFCITVGTAGTILVTTNGGSTWSKKASGTTNSLESVSCANTTVCRAIGTNGTIRATTDGGGSWSGQPSGTTNDLFGDSTQSITVAYAVGASGTILKQ